MGSRSGRMGACLAWYLLAALALCSLQLCSGEKAYVVPSMQQDNPSNHSYRRFGSIVSNKEMLKQYDTIVLTSDYRIVQPSQYDTEPTRLSRNLTVTSANYSTDGYKLLELDFAVQRVLIPEGLRLTFKDLALGRARQTPGQGVPFVVGEGPQSLLVLDNVVRIRTACAHNEPELVTSLSSVGRRDAASNASSSKDEELVRILPSYRFRGKPYYDSILAVDVRYFVGPVDVPDTTYYAGYSMWLANSTRICETYVSDECVVKKGAEACVEEQIALLIKPRETAAAPSAQLSAENLAAVVAPSVVGGVMVLAGAAAGLFLVLRRSRRKQHADSQLSLLPLSDKGGPSTGRAALTRQPYDDAGPDVPLRPANSPTVPLGPFSGADGSIEQLAVGARAGSWQLSAFQAAPEFADATPHDKLALGALLGAGSYARVYSAVWRKRDVAVKILHHDSTTAAAIANEVNLVMSFRHPNIIAAFYYVTWSNTGSAPVQDIRSADQLCSSNSISGAGISSPPPSQQLLSAAGGAARGPLEPLAEAPSTSGTHQSSAAAAAGNCTSIARSGSSAMSSGATTGSTTLQVSLGAQGLLPQQPEPGSRSGEHAQAGSSTAGQLAWSSAAGTYSAGNSSGSNTTHSAGSAGAVAGSASRGTDTQACAPYVSLDGSSAAHTRAPAAQPVSCSPHSVRPVFIGFGAAGELQREQPPQQQFLAVMPAHRSPSSDSAAGRSSSSSEVVPSASVQLVPFTTCQATRSMQQLQLPQQQQQQQQHLSAAAAEGIAYEVSVADSSISTSGVRDPAVCSSSAGCGTSTSLTSAACGGHQQHLPLWQLQDKAAQQELRIKEELLAQQQQHRQRQGQQQGQQLQRFVAVPSRDSPSTPRPQQSYCSQTQSQSQSRSRSPQPAGWLQDATPSSPGPSPSGNKLLSKAARRDTDEAQTWLITELMDGGTLMDLLAPGGALGPELAGPHRLGQVLTLLLDVAAGMSYLHSRNVLHGDLKPGNVLIKHVQGGPYGRCAKVSDFGLSRALQAGQSHKSTRTFGTLNHTPPEAMRLGRLSPAGDVYAFGIILWEAFTGQVAFQGLHYGEVFEQVALLNRRLEIPAGMPADYAGLMTMCWASDPLVRPTFTTVTQRLESMLSNLMQDGAEAQARFVSDL